MPFKSKAQRAWMYANEPDIAKKWEQESKWDKTTDALPNRVDQKGYQKTKGWWKKYRPNRG